MKKLAICTVVFYDGVEGYTTHRALWVDIDGRYKLTAKSKKALKTDFESAGCEILKVDINGQWFDSTLDFMEHLSVDSIYNGDESEVQYIRNKFIEYFVEK